LVDGDRSPLGAVAIRRSLALVQTAASEPLRMPREQGFLDNHAAIPQNSVV
jgi:hypothetical protein